VGGEINDDGVLLSVIIPATVVENVYVNELISSEAAADADCTAATAAVADAEPDEETVAGREMPSADEEMTDDSVGVYESVFCTDGAFVGLVEAAADEEMTDDTVCVNESTFCTDVGLVEAEGLADTAMLPPTLKPRDAEYADHVPEVDLKLQGSAQGTACLNTGHVHVIALEALPHLIVEEAPLTTRAYRVDPNGTLMGVVSVIVTHA
jgi:hypothetical protein